MHYPKVLERVDFPEQIFHRSFSLGAPDNSCYYATTRTTATTATTDTTAATTRTTATTAATSPTDSTAPTATTLITAVGNSMGPYT